MRRLLYVLTLVCLSAPAQAGAFRYYGKPLPPLQVSIAPVQSGLAAADIKPGDVVEFRIRARSVADAGELTIKVELHGGLQLVTGDLSWSGPVKQGEDKTLTITVRNSSQGNGRVVARISTSPASGASFTSQVEYLMGRQTQNKSATVAQEKKDSKGRQIREYRDH